MYVILIKTLLAHFLGDFLLQPGKWVDEKQQKKSKSPKLYLHVIIHGLLIIILVGDPVFAVMIAASHLIIDLVKVSFQDKRDSIPWFIADQSLHLLTIIGIWIFWHDIQIEILSIVDSLPFLLIVTSIVFLTQVCAIGIKVFLANWAGKLGDQEGDSLPQAGKYIGMLERLFVFGFVVLNQWSAIGLLIAAKSVFRFGDISKPQNRKFTEYILIGTLLSFGIAVVTGLWVRTMIP